MGERLFAVAKGAAGAAQGRAWLFCLSTLGCDGSDSLMQRLGDGCEALSSIHEYDAGGKSNRSM